MERLSRRGVIIGLVSQGGRGVGVRRVLDFVRVAGHVWRRRWVSWVQRGAGADVIC